MNPLSRVIIWTAGIFNELPLWKRECRVWRLRMVSPTFERWLYLRAHRLGLMGREEQAYLEKTIRPGLRILDVGSNLGLYSVLMARLAGPTGQLVCFEPDPDLFAALEKSCRLNDATGVECHNLALGSAPAELTLHKSIINSGDNHLGSEDHGLFRRAIKIQVVRLDDFRPRLKIDLVKIDVQGWELEVLRGMRRTLEENPAVQVYFEFWPVGYRRADSSYRELIAFLRQEGFRIFDPADESELNGAAVQQLGERLSRSAGYTNLLASRQAPRASR
jgi:FkbM family methyltransferase